MQRKKNAKTGNHLIIRSPFILIYVLSMGLLCSCNGDKTDITMVLLMGITGSIAAWLIFYIYLYFLRYPKIDLKVIDKQEMIILDFSGKQANIQILTFEFLNKRKFLSNRRIKAEFDLQFRCNFNLINPETTLTDEPLEPLLTIEPSIGSQSRLGFYLKDGRTADEKKLTQVCVDDIFKIVLHPEAIKKNISGDYPGENIRFNLELKDFEINFIKSRKTHFYRIEELKLEEYF
jgi:hypothetical protein